MRRLVVLPLLLAAMPTAAQKPWEMRVDLPVTVPIELPAVPPLNPFAAPVSAPPAVAATPMLAKLATRMHVEAAMYVDRAGACRRVVLLASPLPALAGELSAALQETAFSAGLSRGAPAPAWLAVAFDLAGRIREGRVVRVAPSLPHPTSPPVPEAPGPPPVDARDAALPATPAEQLDAPPRPARFRASLSGRTLRQGFRLLAEVTAEGRCARVVFLSCPDGARDWLLRSLSGWTFRPAAGAAGPVTAWVQLDGELEMELSGLSADRLRATRAGGYPGAAAPPAAGPPPAA